MGNIFLTTNGRASTRYTYIYDRSVDHTHSMERYLRRNSRFHGVILLVSNIAIVYKYTINAYQVHIYMRYLVELINARRLFSTHRSSTDTTLPLPSKSYLVKTTDRLTRTKHYHGTKSYQVKSVDIAQRYQRYLVKLPPSCTIKNCVRTVKIITARNMGFLRPLTMFQLLVMDRALNSLKICRNTEGQHKHLQRYGFECDSRGRDGTGRAGVGWGEVRALLL